MLAKSLEHILNDVFQQARSEGAECVGVERLLRGLLSDSKCREALAASGANIEHVERALDDFIAAAPKMPAESNTDVQPTLGFQRALQRAVFHVQTSARKEEVRCVDVLVALFGERDSIAVQILARQGIERKDVLQQLGEAAWDDLPPDHPAGSPGARRIIRTGVFRAGASQTDIEKRLDALEAKLDTAINAIRDLSAKLTWLIERQPPKD